MNEEYVSLKSYDGKVVRVPIDKKEEYLRSQEKVKYYIEKGKSLKEIIKLLGEKNDK